MNKFLLAASAAVAAMTMAPAASADVYNPDVENGITLTLANLSDGFSSNTLPVGPVYDVFNFFVPISGIATADATFSSTPASALEGFTGGLYDENDNWLSSFQFITFGTGLFGSLDAIAVEGGKNYKLIFAGNANAETSYGGNLAITPVPEPTTWAMMIFGIAAVGFTMRRSQTARVAFS